MDAHTKATMNTLVFPCMYKVYKQATHHIMTVTSIHLSPCDVVVNGFTKFSSICNSPPTMANAINIKGMKIIQNIFYQILT
jgi:hypothetical protein